MDRRSGDADQHIARRPRLAAAAVLGAVVLSAIAATAPDEALALRRPAATNPSAEFSITDQTYFVGTDGHWQVELDLKNPDLPERAFTTPTTAPPAPPPSSAGPAETGPGGTGPIESVPGPTSPGPGSQPPATVPPPRPIVVTISVYPAMTDIDQFDAFDPQGTIGSSGPVDSVSVPFVEVATPTDTGARVVIDVGGIDGAPGNTRPLQIDDDGVFPVRIAIAQDRTVYGSTNTFIEHASESNPTDAVFFPIVANVSDIGPLPSPDQLTAAADQIETLIDLANSTDRPLTAIVPPSVVVAIASKNRATLGRLQRALEGSTVVTGPAFAIDPDVAERDGLQANLQLSWTDGASAIERAFPTSELDNTTAVLDAPLSPAGVALLADVGIRVGITAFSVYSTAVDNEGDRTDPTLLIRVRSGQAGTMPVAVADPRMALLDSGQSVDSTPTARAARVLAYAGMRRRTGPHARTLMLTTPEIGIPDPDTVAAIDRLAADDPQVSWQPLPVALAATDTLSEDDQPVTVTWQEKLTADLSARAEKVGAAGLIVGDAISMLPATDPRRTTWPSDLKLALSTSIDDDQADQLIAESADRSASVRGAVPPPEPFPFTLTGSNTTLRFQLTNNFDTPLDVVVVMSSDRLVVPQRTPVVLQPNAVNNVPIEITARSNGTTKLSMYLETPAGNPLFAPIEMTGRVNTYRGVGQLVSVGALLVLATWWLTHLRRRPHLRPDERSSPPPNSGNSTPPQ